MFTEEQKIIQDDFKNNLYNTNIKHAARFGCSEILKHLKRM
jgi:hypothetical protein